MCLRRQLVHVLDVNWNPFCVVEVIHCKEDGSMACMLSTYSVKLRSRCAQINMKSIVIWITELSHTHSRMHARSHTHIHPYTHIHTYMHAWRCMHIYVRDGRSGYRDEHGCRCFLTLIARCQRQPCHRKLTQSG